MWHFEYVRVGQNVYRALFLWGMTRPIWIARRPTWYAEWSRNL